MPYIHQARREDLLTEFPKTAGELNFTITKLIQSYILLTGKGTNYTTYNEVMGVLSCVTQELYRRVVAPYENVKCETNGDVFSDDIKT